MSEPSLRSIETTDLTTLLLWCRNYNQFNKYPVSIRGRFSIAFYQIYQGMHWAVQGPGNANANEGFMSAALHLMMVSEMADLALENRLDQDLSKLEGLWDAEKLLFHLSRAQQMVWYQAGVNNVKRKSRYNPFQLTIDLAHSIHILVSTIPSLARINAIEHATNIMTGKL